MPKCIDTNFGILLHGYELNILSEQDLERFELHLLKCDHCYNELRSFEQEAALLVEDSQIRSLVDEVLRQADKRESVIGKIKIQLWPKGAFIFRPAVAYFLLLLLIIPAYQGLKRAEKSNIREVQQIIKLTTTHSSGSVLSKSLGETGLLTFFAKGAGIVESYHVVVKSENGATVYENNKFTSFDINEIGRLYLYFTDLEPGMYYLLISDPQADSLSAPKRYFFQIEK